MSTTTHPARKRGNSQCDRILAVLESCAGQWVAMPALVGASGGYAVHSRISDLRKRGRRIEHENKHTNGVIYSFYKLTN